MMKVLDRAMDSSGDGGDTGEDGGIDFYQLHVVGDWTRVQV